MGEDREWDGLKIKLKTEFSIEFRLVSDTRVVYNKNDFRRDQNK